MKTLIVGDIHGEWKHLNNLINHKKPDYILQVGDFGWWPHFHNKPGLLQKNKKFNQFGIKNNQGKLTKIFWIPGNHENWDDLNCISQDEPVEIQTGVTYCPFGVVLELNGTNILMCGGAESTDKEYRTEGIDWWKSEIISQKEMDNLPECEIDIIISHTIPRFFFNNCGWDWLTERKNDPSTFALQLIFEKYRPKKWFSGHFHHYHKQSLFDCEWTSLSMPGICDTWWVEL
jgi:predicted phosphodiesterase